MPETFLWVIIVDKYEYRYRVEEIEKLIKENRYVEAAEIADSIDWKNSREIVTLCEISDLYKVCRRYEDSRDVLLLAYERNPSSRMILYSLCELSIKLGDIVNAIEYYKEFQQVAPRDPGRYVLKYKIFTTQEVGIDERISVLEDLQKLEYKEKWMYELAYLYHMAGYGEKCVEACNQIVMFFGEGKYVIKALELKVQHEPLTDEQTALYSRLTGPEETPLVKEMDVSNNSTMDLQKEIANGLKEVLSGEAVPAADYATEVVLETDNAPIGQPEASADSVQPEISVQVQPEVSAAQVQPEIFVQVQPEVSTVSVQPEAVPSYYSESVSPADMKEITPGRAVYDNAAAVPSVPDTETQAQAAYDSAVSASDTETQAQAAYDNADSGTQSSDNVSETPASEGEDLGGTKIFSIGDIIEIARNNKPLQTARQEKAPVQNERERDPHVVYPRKQVDLNNVRINTGSSIRFPNYDDLTSMEGDGQMSLLVPDQAMVDKQITGQISIEDVLREWEQVRDAGERKWEEDVRRNLIEQTRDMFRDFDEATRNGLREEEYLGPDADESVETEIFIDDDDTEASEQGAVITPDQIVDATPDPDLTEAPKNGDVHEIELGHVVESNLPEPDAEDSTTIMPSVSAIDNFLERYAAEAEERDRLDAEAMKAAESEAADIPFDINVRPGIAAETAETEAGTETAAETAENAAGTESAAETAEAEVGTEPAAEPDEAAAGIVTETAGAAGETVESADDTDTAAEPVAEDIIGSGPENVKEEYPVEADDSEDQGEIDDTTSGEEIAAGQSGEALRAGLESLSDEQKERFESYIQKESGVTQLKDALSKISMDSNIGNALIYADDSDSATELARCFILELASTDSVSAGKAAKIKASTLNAKDAGSVLSNLYGCAIVIQDANELRPETMNSIFRILNSPDKQMFVAMTVNKRSKHRFLNEYGNYLDSFNISFDIEALSNKELGEFGEKYALSREYSIDDMGKLALQTRIEDRQTASHSVMVSEVKEIVDAAIEQASHKGIGYFIGSLTGRIFDKNDMIILMEKHFN